MPFSNRDISNENKKLIINFFNPDCEHCQYMVQQYAKNANKFKGIRWLMVTIADNIEVDNFRSHYHLDALPDIVLLRDSKFQFEKIFGTSVVPSFFVYKYKKLVRKIIGETKIENLLIEDAAVSNVEDLTNEKGR